MIDFSAYIADSTANFTGREWVFQAVNDWLARPAAPRFFLLRGEPGSGKTAIAARLAQLAPGDATAPAQDARSLSAALSAVHFCTLRDKHWIDPRAFAESIATQLAGRYPEYAQALVEQNSGRTITIAVDQEIGTVSNSRVAGVIIEQLTVQGIPPADVFTHMVRAPLEALYGNHFDQPITILVDGVDEAFSYGGDDNILALLAHAEFLPAPVRFIVTANPHVETLRALQRYEPPELDLTAGEGLEASLEDIERFIRHTLDAHAGMVEQIGDAQAVETLVEMLRTSSEGNFLYVASLLEMAAEPAHPMDLGHPHTLPRSLNQVYLWRAQTLVAGQDDWESELAPVLGTLAVAQQGLADAQLAALSGLTRSSVRRVLKAIRPWLDADEALPAGERTYTLFHPSLAEFLLDENAAEEFWTEELEQHRRVTEAVRGAFPDPERMDPGNPLGEYALRYLAYHVRRAGPQYRTYLHELLSPAQRRAKRRHLGSDAAFRRDLAEGIGAALEQKPVDGLPALVRYGLIDATIGSITAVLAPELLYNLARSGRRDRALALAFLSAEGSAAGMAAIVEGALAGDNPDLAWARRMAEHMPDGASDSRYRAQALAAVGAHLIPGDPAQARGLLDAAHAAAATLPALDERGRMLAFVAGRQAALDGDAARHTFDLALAAVNAIEVELDAATLESVVGSNLAAQEVLDKRWTVARTPFDTLGGKARALADVAAWMADSGDTRAEDVFRQAEAVAGQIVEMQSHFGGLQDLFAEHTQGYIAARRQAPERTTWPRLGADEIEAALQASERVPEDEYGLRAVAILALTRALLALETAGGEADGHREALTRLLDRFETTAQAAVGGYRAKLLADGAALWMEIGDTARAGSLAEAAAAIAGDDADLLTSYRAWLVKVGTTWAADLREVAATRAGFQKRRTYSDQALVQTAQSLAAEDLDGASILAENIRDDAQRARALAAIAGHAAAQGAPDAEERLGELLRCVDRLPESERDYVRFRVVQILAPLHIASAQAIAGQIDAGDYRAAALVEVAARLDEDAAQAAWQAAWQAAQPVQQPTLILALGLARLAGDWQNEQAGAVVQRAHDTARGLPSPIERSDALTQLAAQIAPAAPEQARNILQEARSVATQLAGSRAQGHALSRIAGTMMALDPQQACHWLADLRRLGRVNFLDGLAQIAPGAARLGGAQLVIALAEALDAADRFFQERG